MVRKTIVALALIVSLATVAKADTIQVVNGGDGVKLIINHTKNESTLILGDTKDVQPVILIGTKEDNE